MIESLTFSVLIFDLHKVSTDEDILLPSNGCIGYSWQSHKVVPKVSQGQADHAFHVEYITVITQHEKYVG